MKNKTENSHLKPFLKWAGGKRWFVRKYSFLLPKKFNRYIEPFLGSGAVFFYLRPKIAILGDSNSELITTYQALKNNWLLVYQYLEEHQKKHNSKYYYYIRASKPQDMYSRAARFIYLNRTCWNGLYRVNKRGEFNVPIGTKSKVIYDDENFEEISNLLQSSALYICDFEELINKAEEGDFIFVDPPYTVSHNNNSFIKYNERLFSWSDQKRLFRALLRAKERGVMIVGTNAYHKSVLELYKGKFKTIKVSRYSLISSRNDSRKKYDELVFMNGGDYE